MQTFFFQRAKFLLTLVKPILFLSAPLILLLYSTRVQARTIPIGPGTFTLQCLNNQDGRTARVNWTIDGVNARISLYRIVVYNNSGLPITILRTELSGYNTVGEEIRIVWMGFNEGWVQV